MADAPDNVVRLDVARLDGRDNVKLLEVIRLLEELGLNDSKPLVVERDGEERWILLFGRIVEDSHG